MPAATSPTLAAAFPPPVMEARAWLAETPVPADRPLLNLSQAAPTDPPHPALCEEMARLVREDPSVHGYGPVLGLPALRETIAARWSAAYCAAIPAEAVAITAGCNQAFCAAVASVAAPGDQVILPTPWYFNHKMWLDMAGVETLCLPTEPSMEPDPARAAALITPRTRAIVLVTPNNPTGAEYPPALMAAFAALADRHGLALIVDETYRDFHSAEGAPHGLFQTPDWPDWLIHLYSFSKVFRLTGHRVGAMITAPRRLAEIEKFLDTTTICPAQLGQHAALFGLTHLADWVAAERAEILSRRAAAAAAIGGLEGWSLLGCGAYFAYLAHPFDMPSDLVARALLAEQSILTLPGTMFAPTRAAGGTGAAERQLRIAFANADSAGIATLARRLARFAPEADLPSAASRL